MSGRKAFPHPFSEEELERHRRMAIDLATEFALVATSDKKVPAAGALRDGPSETDGAADT